MQSVFTTIYEVLNKQGCPLLQLIERDEVIDPNHSIHRHDGFELRFVFAPERSSIEELQIVFPGICHASLAGETLERAYVLSFTPHGIFYSSGGGEESGVFRSPYQERLFTVLASLRDRANRVAGWQEELYFLLCLLHLRADAFPENLGKEMKFEQAVRYIQTFYYQRDLSVQEVLRKFGCNSRDAKKFFFALTGMLPNEYLQSVRMRAAEKLLRENRYLVKEVAVLCGFADAHYFANRFRKFYHRSPSGKSE